MTGPTPGSASSCSSVALFRWTGPEAAPPPGVGATAATDPRAGHDDLLSVCDPGGEIDELDLRLGRRPARARDRIGHARPVAQPVQAGPSNGPDDVDVQRRRGELTRLGRRDTQRRRNGRRLRRPQQELARQHERQQQHHARDDDSPPIESDLWHVANRGNERVTCP